VELNTYQRYLVEEFADDYQERQLDRRELLRKVLLVTGSIPVTALTLTSLGCGTAADEKARATATASAAASTPTSAATAAASPSVAPTNVTQAGATVLPTDPAIEVADIRFKGPASDILAYQAKPKGNGPFAALIVIHENRGLTEHIKDIARRYAKEGFAAFAIDLVSRDGGTKADTALNTGFLGRANPDDLIADLVAMVGYMKTQPFVRAGALGVTGFCFGGGYVWETAIASPDIKAAVPYYGPLRLPDPLSKTNAAVLAIYGGNDTRITSQAPNAEEKLKAPGKTVEIKVYPGANHAFFNDTGTSYNAEAASQAWPATLAWFRKYLA
jgi:carboxymethylenebutenolidase